MNSRDAENYRTQEVELQDRGGGGQPPGTEHAENAGRRYPNASEYIRGERCIGPGCARANSNS